MLFKEPFRRGKAILKIESLPNLGASNPERKPNNLYRKSGSL